MGHGQYPDDAVRERACIPECLHTDDHGGPPYTLVDRVRRGFGESAKCRTPDHLHSVCGHTANSHVEDGESVSCIECSCESWTEPPETEVEGMGPDAPVTVNGNGAGQSEIPAVFTTMPLRALWELSKLQKQGDLKYGPHNWRGIPEQDHIDHAFSHLMADRLGDVSDQHLLHATWRLMAALETRIYKERGLEHGAFERD